MIPKILHFIWIGNLTPKYVDFSIQAYSKANKDFKIHAIKYTIQQLEKIYFDSQINSYDDKLVHQLIEDILHKTKYKDLINRQINFLNQFGKIPFIQLFNDIYRLELLNIYGGIYVDCDTFPIKQFDDKLLSFRSFCVKDLLDSNVTTSNNYFIGSDRKEQIENYFDLESFVQTNNYNIHIGCKKPFDFAVRRIKFFSCKLSKNDFANIDNSVNYIEHYSDFRWSLERKSLESKFDSYLMS